MLSQGNKISTYKLLAAISNYQVFCNITKIVFLNKETWLLTRSQYKKTLNGIQNKDIYRFKTICFALVIYNDCIIKKNFRRIFNANLICNTDSSLLIHLLF